MCRKYSIFQQKNQAEMDVGRNCKTMPGILSEMRKNHLLIRPKASRSIAHAVERKMCSSSYCTGRHIAGAM